MGLAYRSGLRRWLKVPGSLSQHLARLGQRFEVQVLSQRVAPLRRHEQQALGLPRSGLTVVREVLLRVDGEPLVWARSALHQSALAGPWKALKGLGSRPLAHLLYDDPRIRRSTLQPRRLSRHGHTRRHLQRQWRQATGSDPSAQMLWSRNSIFSRQGALLRVMETFVPHMKALARPGAGDCPPQGGQQLQPNRLSKCPQCDTIRSMLRRNITGQRKPRVPYPAEIQDPPGRRDPLRIALRRLVRHR